MSEHGFACLLPANALARLAFSDLYDALTFRRQNNQGDGAQAALRHIRAEPEQTCDNEIVRLRREMERTKYDTDGEASETLTEPDTDTEQQLQELGMVWVGHYVLDLQCTPAIPGKGWTVGKGPLENLATDLLLCTRSFAKLHQINLRNPHARFNFSRESKSFFIMGCSRSLSTRLRVNGDAVELLPYHLNQHRMKIQLDKLEYYFQWTENAAKDEFTAQRRRYVTDVLGGSPATDIHVEMPTPTPNTRQIGRWTLRHALGSGGQGRVFFASDSSGNIAAIKVVERTSRNCHCVDEETRTLQEVTDFAQSSDSNGRILRVAEVLYSDGKEFSSKTFDNVNIVMMPMTPHTFGDLVGPRSKGGSKGMTIEAASAFRSALLGVKVMHDGRWLHRDLKPTNIGLIGEPPRSVLLDVGTARRIEAGGSLRPQPGTVGTVGYLAPELELEDYDCSIDIWSMGIVLFELTYKFHPWKYALNPWRRTEKNAELRPAFQKSYQLAIEKMDTDYRKARDSPTKGYIHLGGLFIDMVRYRWAATNHGRRPSIDEVLQHPAWGPLLAGGDMESGNSPPAKRQRLGEVP